MEPRAAPQRLGAAVLRVTLWVAHRVVVRRVRVTGGPGPPPRHSTIAGISSPSPVRLSTLEA